MSKRYITLGLMLVSGVIFAHTTPKLEAHGDMVKATYYYDNGKIMQEGYFKNGKPEGNWVAYDVNGNKKSIGEYANGEKTGKWVFWSNEALTEVDYSNSKIDKIKTWEQKAILKN
jgi:antitoxin component YwqK of YwqJK toxin-antitoxin module